jgi:serine/threonine protein kinase
MQNKPLKRAQELLINEMRVHLMANHPNIVRTEYIHNIYDKTSTYPHPITTLIFMDLCDGDLAQLMLSRKPMTEAISGKWFCQMAQALDFLYRIGVAHRDIKPANILYKIGPNGGYCFKLTDFGLVKIFDNKHVMISPVLHKSKTYIGTEDYMAPEIEAKGPDDEYDPFKADVFSLGVCLLQTMKTMFKSLVEKFKNNAIQDVERRVKGMSNELKDLLLKMLSYDPNYRLSIDGVCSHLWLKKFSYVSEFIDLENG